MIWRKWFNKISLSLLELHFKILSSRIWRLGQVKKKVEGLAMSLKNHQALKSFHKCYLFDQNVVIICSFQTPVINKAYVLGYLLIALGF